MDTVTELVLRPATEDDLAAMAEILWEARAAAVPWMPPSARSFTEVREHYLGLRLDRVEAWVAQDEADLLGFAMVTDDWLDDLYVRPHAQRAGAGSALLDVVKALRPGGFALWVFAANRPARAFYARHGLVECERTDGTGNDERAPDIRVVWAGAPQVTGTRSSTDGGG